MASRLLVVQHEPSAPPGLLTPAAAATGVELQVVEAPGQPVPTTLDGADGLVVLGGVMDADETDAYPHLARTMDLVRDAAARSVPTLGICLGAQLAAAALGGRAYPGPAGEELGWTKVELTEAGRAVAAKATDELNASVFARPGLSPDAVEQLVAVLTRMRADAGDF